MSAGDVRLEPRTTGRTSTVPAARSATDAATVTSPDPHSGTKVRLDIICTKDKDKGESI